MAQITCNFDNVQWTEMQEFIAQVQKGNLTTVNGIANKCIIKWSYVDDDENPLPIDLDNLTVKEAGEVVRTLFNQVSAIVTDPNTEGFTCNIDYWKWGDFTDYQHALQKGAFVDVEKRISEVVFYDGKHLQSPLNFFDGIVANKLVMGAVAEALSGEG